ncbi:MAG: hypothetical protein HKN04_10045 [Rhodothermaceae bacterium]|nr:hypothetical protein [Rhodothermaceae bacterium]
MRFVLALLVLAPIIRAQDIPEGTHRVQLFVNPFEGVVTEVLIIEDEDRLQSADVRFEGVLFFDEADARVSVQGTGTLHNDARTVTLTLDYLGLTGEDIGILTLSAKEPFVVTARVDLGGYRRGDSFSWGESQEGTFAHGEIEAASSK